MSVAEESLPRTLGMLDSVAIIVGIIIGVGIFRVPGSIAGYLDSPSVILAAWVVGGVLSLCGALCYAELAASLPRTGGGYVYLREAYGPGLGFTFAWTELLVTRAGSIASIAFIFAGYVAYFFPLSPVGMKAVAGGAILILTAVNVFGLRFGKSVQNTLSVLKVLAVLGLGLFALWLGKGDPQHLRPAQEGTGTLPGVVSFGMALIFVLWTYGGWHESTNVAGEMRHPRRDLPMSLLIGTVGIIALYVLANVAYLYCIPLSEMAGSEMVGAQLAERLFGTRGGTILASIVLVSALGALNGLILTGARISYALANDHPAFGRIGKVHTRYRTPAFALILNGAWAILLVLSGTFDRLISYTSAVTWLFFGLTGAGIFVLRRKFPDLERPYTVWGYPVVPAIFIAASIWLVYNTVMYSPTGSLFGVGIMVLGVPLYLFSRRSAASRQRR